ncbi:MAG: PASTA domain-containing protein [Ruminococcus sp.]|nr:PASTA domain-containing protein [Ruminococcus sp.]
MFRLKKAPKPTQADAPTRVMKNRLTRYVVFVLFLIVIYIITQIFKVSVTEAEQWQELANSQQVRSTVIPASRGSIFDTNGQVLAQSATVYTVYVDPVMLWDDYLDKRDAKIKELKELIEDEDDKSKLLRYQERLAETKSTDQSYSELVSFLAQTLKVEPESVREHCTNKESRYEIIKKNVEKTVASKIEEYLTKEKLDGIRCEPATKRFYPQGALAANVLGHLSYDGDGIYGIEAYYDNYLRGIDGRVITATARDGTEIPYRYRQSYDAQDGSSLVLNIDVNIQYQLEKALAKGVSIANPTDRACGIVMNPKTGAVLAMATNYSYDPNSPADITDDKSAAKLAALPEDSKEYKKVQLEAWSEQWKNKAVSELYNPGSVFKVITGSSALEQQVITLNDTFPCNTFIQVADHQMHCWSFVDHGSQNLALAMTNSCNPAFVQIGQRLGVEGFSKFFRAYGFTEKTGIDLPGEADSIYHREEDMTIVDLSASSFGQSNKITPIQMISAFSAVINGGYLMTPQVVDKIVDSKGNVITDNEPVMKRQVISEDVSKTMREILENVVVSEPTGNCNIKGYRIGGKSGTSQKLDEDETGNTYVASYCAFAPADDPEIIMLVMIDHPTGQMYYGSELAAPVCVEVMSEVLPYLGYFPQYTDDELAQLQVTVPNVEFAPIENARKTLDEAGLKVNVQGKGDSVVKQVPVTGNIEKGGTVVLYTEEGYTEKLVTVPNLKGLTREKAKAALEEAGLNLTTLGSAADSETAVADGDQNYAAQTVVPEGTAVSVTFKDE